MSILMSEEKKNWLVALFAAVEEVTRDKGFSSLFSIATEDYDLLNKSEFRSIFTEAVSFLHQSLSEKEINEIDKLLTFQGFEGTSFFRDKRENVISRILEKSYIKSESEYKTVSNYIDYYIASDLKIISNRLPMLNRLLRDYEDRLI